MRRPTLSYYDKILAAIAVSLGAGSLFGVVTAYRYQVGLLVGALVATLFVYDAIFRNPPQPPVSTQAKTAAVVWHVFLAMLVLRFL